MSQSSNTSSPSSSTSSDNTEINVELTKEEIKKLEYDIDLLTNENQDLDDEISFAQEQLNRLESTSLIQQEENLKHTLSEISNKVETLMEATEALEEADLIEGSNVIAFTTEQEQKLDKEIESLQAEITETQHKLDQLQKQ